MPSYLTTEEFLTRFDVDMLIELMTDDRVVPDRKDLATNTRILAVIQDASGRVESSLLQGGRYTTKNLTELTDNSQQYLKRIVATIALTYLLSSRPSLFSEIREQMSVEANEYLKELSSGKEVLTIDANIQAGLIDMSKETRNLTLLQQNRGLLADQLSGNLFQGKNRDNGRRGRTHP